jgi:hypothetical protein
MAFKFNSATGKFEVVPSTQKPNENKSPFPALTTAQKSDPKLRQLSSQFGMSPQQLLYGTTPQNKAANQAYKKATATSSTPYGVGQGTYGQVSLAEPSQNSATYDFWANRPDQKPPTPAPVNDGGQPDPQGVINSLWQNVYDEAAQYQTIYGDAPPAGWWSARTAPIEAAQKRLDTTAKGGGAAAAAAAKAKKEETERIRNVKGGREGEAFLREQAVTRKADMLKRVAELYDPQQTKNAEDLKTILKQASDAYDLAEKQVGEAQTNFQQQFKPSTAYEGIPVATYSVADNPLIAALQQQGAGTGQVDAATNYARQFAEQTSGLEKWAASQLSAGQKNYESAAQNAAQMGTMAALQGLSARRADVKTGIEQQFADALAKIGESRTQASSDVDNVIADIIAKADEMRAKTTSDYGLLPSETQKPVVKKPVVKKPVVKKPETVTPVVPSVVKPSNIKQNVR